MSFNDRDSGCRDSMHAVKSSSDTHTLVASVNTAGGVYSVTAFSDLLAQHSDPAAAGMLISLTGYTTPAHMARATLRDITIERPQQDSSSPGRSSKPGWPPPSSFGVFCGCLR